MVGDACRSESIAARNRIGGGGRAWDTEQHVGAGMMGAAVPSNWEVCDAELYAILLYLRTVVLERD